MSEQEQTKRNPKGSYPCGRCLTLKPAWKICHACGYDAEETKCIHGIDLTCHCPACATCCIEELRKELEETKAQLRPFQKVPNQVKDVLDCADVDTHHPDIGAAERKPMMLHERVAALVKERDEWKRRAGNAEYELNRQKNLMQPNPVDWERERINAALAALQGLLANHTKWPVNASPQQCAELAVAYADALIAELQKKEGAK